MARLLSRIDAGSIEMFREPEEKLVVCYADLDHVRNDFVPAFSLHFETVEPEKRSMLHLLKREPGEPPSDCR